jgi:hypothetical protein
MDLGISLSFHEKHIIYIGIYSNKERCMRNKNLEQDDIRDEITGEKVLSALPRKDYKRSWRKLIFKIYEIDLSSMSFL